MISSQLTERGNEIVDHLANQQVREVQTINEEVIREAARHLAQEMATALAIDRLRSMAGVAADDMRQVLWRRIELILRESGVDEDIRQTLVSNVDGLINTTILMTKSSVSCLDAVVRHYGVQLPATT